MTTLKEYLNKYYPNYLSSYNMFGSAIPFFPSMVDYDDSSHNVRDGINYNPFDFINSNTGGIFSDYVGDYIINNALQLALSEYHATVLKSEQGLINLARTPIKNATLNLIYQNKWKWNSIFEAMLQEYDMLDNVNEYTTESTERVPNLVRTQSDTNVVGNVTENITNTYGDISEDSSITHGQQSSTINETIGEREDSTTTNLGTYTDNKTDVFAQRQDTHNNTYGAHNDSESYQYGSHTDETIKVVGALSGTNTSTETRGNDTRNTLNSVYPFDSAEYSRNTDEQQITDSFGNKTVNVTSSTQSQTNSDTTNFGQKTDSKSLSFAQRQDTATDTIGNHTDTSQLVYGARSNNEEYNLGEQINTTTNSSNSYIDRTENTIERDNDTIAKTTSSRTDTNSSRITDSGLETIMLNRRRHGNIGVTTSGQLLEDFIRAHSYNLVKIVAQDIIDMITTGLYIF